MTSTTPDTTFTLRREFPPLILKGYDSDDHCIVAFRGFPRAEQLRGEEDDCRRAVRWECGLTVFRRIAALHAWEEVAYKCEGRA